MATIDTSNRPPTPVWSRRPYVGALPKVFRSPLATAEVLARLKDLADGPGTVGAVDGNAAWVRPRGGAPLPARTLRLTVSDDDAGARILCRFDASQWDSIDLWVYTGAAAIGFGVAGSWLSGHMPALTRAKISAAVPICLAALAVVALAHYGFRRWRQAVRDRLFDQTMMAVGVPIE